MTGAGRRGLLPVLLHFALDGLELLFVHFVSLLDINKLRLRSNLSRVREIMERRN